MKKLVFMIEVHILFIMFLNFISNEIILLRILRFKGLSATET